jgi:hypothetical protein
VIWDWNKKNRISNEGPSKKKKQQCSIKKPELIWINSQGNLVERKLKKWQSSMINNLILNDKIKKNQCHEKKAQGKIFE